jgi:hypothetical protein
MILNSLQVLKFTSINKYGTFTQSYKQHTTMTLLSKQQTENIFFNKYFITFRRTGFEINNVAFDVS